MDASRFRILPAPGVTAGAFVITGEQPVLVDTGMRGSARRVLRAARSASGNAPVTHVLLTHWHIDHVGSAAEIQRKTGARVYAHQGDIPFVEGRETLGLAGDETRRSRFVQSLLRRLYRPCSVDVAVTDGEVLPLAGGIQVLHLPGHTPGSVCYYHQPTSSLFLGDVLTRRQETWGLPSPRFTANAAQARASLARLYDLRVCACYFGHGAALTTGAQGPLTEALDALASRPG